MITPRRLALLALLGATVFAMQGGEYSTWDWLELRREERQERARIAQLQEAIDSLARVARAVETDPQTQERIARELYGMIRDGEFLYRLVP